ncbi:unnamed protein product [Rotaria socialis]|uniref:Uncharacterized protein n=1 Tax=Rotaria socialis TaxID=392032 RepID=A0A821XRS9_9BILA|nr:unnamed protein product [Rotaria socialis]CAF4380583.1 unnamed protein product [Rotaria socialis]CAF4950882.1 unnamed protein product [Rotaria socialis]
MQTSDQYNYQDEGSLHPLWLGILILIFVIAIIGISCCLRIRFASQCHKLFSRANFRKNENPEDVINNDKNAPNNFSYHWSSIYTLSQDPSPKCSTLIPSIYVTDSHDDLCVQLEDIDDDKVENESNSGDRNQMSLSSSIEQIRNSEIARRFFASMRSSIDHPNSTLFDSYASESSLASINGTAMVDQNVEVEREPSVKMGHTPCFFHSIPYTGSKQKTSTIY